MPEFQTIEHLIPNFGGRVDDPPASPQQQASLQSIFENLLGQSARFIQPVLFRSGRLIIYAEAAVWGQHIKHRHATLMEQCKHEGLHVQNIEVKVRPNPARARPEVERKCQYNVKAVSQQLDKLAAQTESEQLRQTLTRLAKRMRDNHPEQDD